MSTIPESLEQNPLVPPNYALLHSNVKVWLFSVWDAGGKKVQENTAFDKIEQENQIQIFQDNKRANLLSNATQSGTVIY